MASVLLLRARSVHAIWRAAAARNCARQCIMYAQRNPCERAACCVRSYSWMEQFSYTQSLLEIKELWGGGKVVKKSVLPLQLSLYITAELKGQVSSEQLLLSFFLFLSPFVVTHFYFLLFPSPSLLFNSKHLFTVISVSHISQTHRSQSTHSGLQSWCMKCHVHITFQLEWVRIREWVCVFTSFSAVP